MRERTHWQVDAPVHPAPVLAVRVGLLKALDVSQRPADAVVDADLAARDLAATAVVRVPTHSVGRTTQQRYDLIVLRVGDG